MFKLLHKSNPAATPLLSSRLFDESLFYKVFINDLKASRNSVIIESPYLTIRRVLEIAPMLKKLCKKQVKVRVNTREPRHHGKQLEYEAKVAIKILQQSGVDVYVCRDFRHRKLAVIDGLILWEGSLNILSQNKSSEVMRRTVSQELCEQMVRFTGINKRW